jgi:hypothetical protein
MRRFVLKKACLFLMLIAWTGTLKIQAQKLGYWAAADVYWSKDLSLPDSTTGPDFLFNHHRNGEVALNLAVAGLVLDHDKFRGRFALMAGSYVETNLAAEPAPLQSIFEANAGIKLGSNLWLDAGIFQSYLGAESLLPLSNPCLGRSTSSEQSPYYLTGARLEWTPNTQLKLQAWINNGWQRIRMPDAYTHPGFGWLVEWNPSDSLTLSHGGFYGHALPDSANSPRLFQNTWIRWKAGRGFALWGIADVGMENAAGLGWKPWFYIGGVVQKKWSARWSSALRADYYHDPEGREALGYWAPNLRLLSSSANLCYSPSSFVRLGLEGRYMHVLSAATAQMGPHNWALMLNLSFFWEKQPG